MVLDLAHLGARRQQLVEMPAPSRWILPLTKAAHRRPIEHGFDSAAQSRGRFRLLRPQGLDDLHHQRGVNAVNRKRPDCRLGVRLKRRAPLRRVLGVAPAGAVSREILLGALPEGQRGGCLKGSLGAVRSASLNRIDTFVNLPSALGRLCARFGQPKDRERTEAHFAGAAAKGEAEDPGFGRRVFAVACNLQIEAPSAYMPGFLTFAPFSAVGRPTGCAISAWQPYPRCYPRPARVYPRFRGEPARTRECIQTLKLWLFFRGLADGSEQMQTLGWRRGRDSDSR